MRFGSAVMLLLLALRPSPLAAQAATSDMTLSLASLGYNDNSLEGTSVGSDYFFQGPGELPLAAAPSTLTIEYRALDAAVSNFQLVVAWNNTPLATVPGTTGERRAQTIPIPNSRVDPVLNRVTISATFAAQRNDCAPPRNAKFTVLRETSVRYALADSAPHPPPVVPDLGRYPAPLITGGLSGSSSDRRRLAAHTQ